MRILFVVHQFLPRHQAGTELYTGWLAKALQRAGHDVRLYFTAIRPDRKPYSRCSGEYEGLPFDEVVHNRSFATFERTYLDPEMEGVFRSVLDDFTPDIVHFQHLQLHSIGYIDVARERRLPMVFTLHDYMLACLRSGLLLRPGSTLCPAPERGACTACARESFVGTPRSRRSLAALVDRVTTASGPFPSVDNAAIERRQREIAARLPHVDLFLSPSAFLRDRFIEFGLVRPDRIVHSDNGIAAAPRRGARREEPALLRVGFVGTIAEHKGVHVLVEAMAGIEDDGVRCTIHGPLDYFPTYAKKLEHMPGIERVELCGAAPRETIPGLLAEIDVLVVPSIWPENSPLTIREAFLAGVPVITSDCGGMAELVADGVNGLHFALGDAGDLRAKILRVRHEPGLLDRLRAGIPAVKSIDSDAESMVERYSRLLGARHRAARGEALAAAESALAARAAEPDVTILIPTYDAGPDFPEIFDRMADQEFDGTVEFLIVDSGSTDGTLEYVKRRGARTLEIPNSEFNHGLTRKLGVSRARGRIVVLATQDARPYDRHWLKELVDCFADPAVVGAYSCQLPKPDADLFIKDRLGNWSASGSEPRVQRVTDRAAFDALTPLEKLACVTFDNVSSAIRRSCAAELPFRERQFGEDIDWAHRAILAGYKIAYQPRSKVVHSHDNSIWYEFKRIYLDHQNLHRVFHVHTVPRRRDVLRCTAAQVRHLFGVVDAAALPPRAALRWKLRAVPFGFTQNLAQYLGAGSVAKLEAGGIVGRSIDRLLRRGV